MANNENLIPIKKGEVRNPNGRPKGSRNKSVIFKELLNSEGKDGLKKEQVLIKKLYNLATQGDLKAIQTIFDGAFGKDKQVVEQTNVDVKPPKVTIIKK